MYPYVPIEGSEAVTIVDSRATKSVAELGPRLLKSTLRATPSARSKLGPSTRRTLPGLSCVLALVTLVTERLIHSNLEQLLHEWLRQRRVEGEAKGPLRRGVLFKLGP